MYRSIPLLSRISPAPFNPWLTYRSHLDSNRCRKAYPAQRGQRCDSRQTLETLLNKEYYGGEHRADGRPLTRKEGVGDAVAGDHKVRVIGE